MSRRPATEHGSRVAFRIAAIAALTAAVGQIVLGGVVRVTGSGLGCPDWPLCHGQLVPPMELATLIEYSHRLSATVLGLLVLTITAIAWSRHRADRLITVPSTLALVFLILAALLGGVTVLTELEWWTVLLHLGIAEALVACLVVALLAGWAAPHTTTGKRMDFKGFDLLVIGALVAVFALIISGSYMVGVGYGASCSTWPLCNGSLLPRGDPYLVHMGHRFVAAIAGGLIASIAITGWLRTPSSAGIRWASLVVAGLFVAQAAAGAATVWTGFSAALKSTHLGLATLLWVSLVSLAALNFAQHRLDFRGAASRRTLLPRLERVAP